MNQIPVFVFPDALHFGPDARTRTLSLYNPYDFALRFHKPRAFALSAAEGVVRARHCLDIVVRARDQAPSARFLVKVHEQPTTSSARAGERQVLVQVSAQAREADGDRFEAAEALPLGGARIEPRRLAEDARAQQLNQMALVAVGVACGLGLLAPATWLSSGQKLALSYALGIITVLILRQ